jgi:uncharacterized lipoprotein YbaY
MRSGPFFLLLAGFISLLCGLFACHPQNGGKVTGTASYREHIGLPGNAVFEARLVDLSTRRVIGTTRIAPIGDLPVRFAIEFDQSVIKTSHAYGVEARIDVEKRTWFAAEPAPVLTRGHDEKVVLALHRGGSSSPAPNPGLEEPRISGDPETVAEDIDRRLSRLTRLEGTYRDDGRGASYTAYLERGAPVLIKVGRQEQGGGSSSMGFYYQSGALIRYEEDSLKRPSGDEHIEMIHVVFNFTDGTLSGTKFTVNNRSRVPKAEEVAEAKAQGAMARERVLDRLRVKSAER